MRDQIEQFLDHIAAEKGSPPNTVAAYRNDLLQFTAFLQGRVSGWQDTGEAVIGSYIAALLAEHDYASSTVARKVAAIKSFFHYLAASGKLADDPTVMVDSPRPSRELPRVVPAGDMDRLLVEPDRSGKRQSRRDRALLELLYATGLRVAELVALDVDDILLDSSSVRVIRPRDGQERLVPIHEQAMVPVRDYMEQRLTQLARQPGEVALFVNHRGRRLTRQGLWLIVKQYARRVGIVGDVTPQMLRHTLALHLLEQNADPEYVQQLLGYASLATTPILARVRSDTQSGD